MIFDPQSWYADSELEIIACDLPPSFHRGYRSVISEPLDYRRRQLVYNFMLALGRHRASDSENRQERKMKVLDLSNRISEIM